MKQIQEFFKGQMRMYMSRSVVQGQSHHGDWIWEPQLKQNVPLLYKF